MIPFFGFAFTRSYQRHKSERPRWPLCAATDPLFVVSFVVCFQYPDEYFLSIYINAHKFNGAYEVGFVYEKFTALVNRIFCDVFFACKLGRNEKAFMKYSI